MEEYLHALERALRLGREETQAIVTEVRGTLEDLVAYLQSQGMERAAAEQIALGRFGAARDLARAMRRAHGRAPLPLRVLALALLAAGIGGLAILGSMAQSLIWIAGHKTDASPTLFRLLPGPNRGLFDALGAWQPYLIRLSIIPVCAAASLALAAIVMRGARPRWRLVTIVLCLVTLCDIAGSLLLWPWLAPQYLASPAAWAIPDLKQLQAAGLVRYPDARQPASPVRVDLVVVGSAATYVAFTVPDPLHSGYNWQPRLFDGSGHEYISLGATSRLDNDLQLLLPWRSASPGLAVFEGVPAGTRVVDLRFGAPTSASETVRVSLHPRALADRRTAQPKIATSLHGITLSIGQLSNGPVDASLTYRISSPATRPVSFAERVTLTDGHGHGIAQSPISSSCSERVDHGSSCLTRVSFAAQPAGSRVVLTIQDMALFPPYGGTSIGPWRLAITMP